MSAQTRGLGRGLSALIPAAGTQTQPAASDQAQGAEHAPGILRVPVTEIIPNPRQPRTEIAPETLEELAASIRQHGLIQPLIVTSAQPTDPARYQLIAGERRWRAAQLAGLDEVPVLVKEVTSQELLELALIENIQRADLNALEEAAAYHSLMTDFRLTQQEVANRVGKSRVAVANAVRLLRLPDAVKTLLATRVLSEGHARALLGLDDDEMLVQAAQQVVARELTVRQTEALVRRLQATAEALAAEPDPDPAEESQSSQTRQLEQAFRGVLGTKVDLMRGRRGGKLVIHFYSDEELQSIYEQIVGMD